MTARAELTLALVDPVDALLSGTGITSSPDGIGKIDLYTNGFVYDIELNGDLRAGQIISTASDVTLVAPRSVLDAENGTGVLGTDPTHTDVEGVQQAVIGSGVEHPAAVPVVTRTRRMRIVQCAAWPAVASQPSRCDIARVQLTTARTWSEVSVARHSTDHG